MITIIEETETTIDEATVSVYAESVQDATDRATTRLNREGEKQGKAVTADKLECIGSGFGFFTFYFHSREED